MWSPGAPVYALATAREAQPLPERLRDGAEHDRIRGQHPEPYVLELETAHGALLYYGAHHTDDFADPQLADIRARWSAFQPTVALCEGRSRGYLLGPLFPRFGMSEPALVHELARAGDVPLYSLEPEYAAEVLLLLQRFAPADLALFFTLRVERGNARRAARDRRGLTRGERVLAVVGSGHVIRQEWALRSALGAEPASDQPIARR